MDASGNIIATDNPSDKLDASLTLDLAAGDYFVAVQGVGNRTLIDGYSDYGSLGQYTIEVDVRPPVLQLPGDANLDGQVDAADLNTVGLNWQGFGKTWSQGDFNGDGRVDAADLNALALNWRLAVLPM